MTQSAFAAALLNPDLPVPDGLVDPVGQRATTRFAVYRNNVAGGLTRVLEAAFPAVRKLVGPEFFAAMAGVFLRTHPPESRIMMLYGARFPDFLQGFPPVAHLGYLPDVARVEQALRESYHAADHRPADLAAVAPEQLLNLRLRLSPTVRLIRSCWPVYAIWAANMRDGPPPVPQGEDVLVLRKGFDPEPHLLPLGGAAFIAALAAGKRLSDAIDACEAETTASAVLSLLVQAGSIKEVTE